MLCLAKFLPEVFMNNQTLSDELILFLESPLAKRTCWRYRADPAEAMGYLYEKLAPKLGRPISNRRVWVGVNAGRLLQNFFRRETPPLCQRPESED